MPRAGGLQACRHPGAAVPHNYPVCKLPLYLSPPTHVALVSTELFTCWHLHPLLRVSARPPQWGAIWVVSSFLGYK